MVENNELLTTPDGHLFRYVEMSEEKAELWPIVPFGDPVPTTQDTVEDAVTNNRLGVFTPERSGKPR